MKYKSKRLREATKGFDFQKVYALKEAISLIKSVPPVKFDQTMNLSIKLGVDPKKADQQVRSTVSLPHGTGRKARILVFAKGDKAKDAENAGADFVGGEELAEKIEGGWVDFTHVIATPDMMRVVGKLGKVLGPRGLMPSPKTGAVTQDVAQAVREVKAGKIEFKVDKGGNIHTFFGKMSFSGEKLLDNFTVLMEAIAKSRPTSVKGNFIQSVSISSTMGPGFRVEHQTAQAG
ncbi:MAG: 50S ribosomal protein L1 [Verrucomicrobia bacterium]|jgi:large subunit ribosomal protein L1|nr:50S ribosomal protein L1 [Verrucomicrobiota bacterium]